ncbi:MAG: hypothetical protein A3E87_03165 [Gammaproteobacteria bacterium RIFCSPHIGHO2_12_FULL_35_23]|nr:MAG: hypothetical protein A3E87_03165 [Gammaproteobacteria bacterium RIFCSPHIGHO2_12_FULL_35_23]
MPVTIAALFSTSKIEYASLQIRTLKKPIETLLQKRNPKVRVVFTSSLRELFSEEREYTRILTERGDERQNRLINDILSSFPIDEITLYFATRKEIEEFYKTLIDFALAKPEDYTGLLRKLNSMLVSDYPNPCYGLFTSSNPMRQILELLKARIQHRIEYDKKVNVTVARSLYKTVCEKYSLIGQYTEALREKAKFEEKLLYAGDGMQYHARKNKYLRDQEEPIDVVGHGQWRDEIKAHYDDYYKYHSIAKTINATLTEINLQIAALKRDIDINPDVQGVYNAYALLIQEYQVDRPTYTNQMDSIEARIMLVTDPDRLLAFITTYFADQQDTITYKVGEEFGVAARTEPRASLRA